MMRSAPGFAQICWLLTACCALNIMGCDKVGQPLVDTLSGSSGSLGPIECAHPLSCADSGWIMEAPLDADGGVIEPLSAAPVEFEGCAPAYGSKCQKPADEEDGGTATDAASCEVEWALKDKATVAADQGALSCGQLRIVPADPAEPASALLSKINWKHANVLIRSSQPLTIELDGASLQDAFIRLEGPVVLRIADSARFDKVRISGAPNGEVPRVELEHVSGEDFIAGDSTERFPGTVAITRSALPRAQLTVANLQLESVLLKYGLVDATTLDADDLKLLSTVLSAQTARFSACWLTRVQLTECGAMTLMGSQVAISYIPGCSDEPLRVYNGTVTSSIVDGAIESDTTTWFKVLFGMQESTDLLAWDGMVASVNFCSYADTARLANYVFCSRCSDGLRGTKAVCAMAFSDDMAHNYCDKLNKPSKCPAPQPVRERP